jgi:thiamine-monophosphate kinase
VIARRSARRLLSRRGRLGEFELIAKLTKGWNFGSDVLIGPGDDASAVRWTEADGVVLLQTTDLLIEDVHFRKGWGSPRQLGWKALAVNLSDIAAMGGRPLQAHLNLAIPSHWPQREILAFQSGFRELAERYGISLLGGDLSSSRGPLVVSVMVNGQLAIDRVIRRRGAMPGDIIWVSGTLGDAAGGLNLLKKVKSSVKAAKNERALLNGFLQPKPEVDLGLICSESGCVHAMIDISDGLAGDLGHILELSKVGAILDQEKFPISKALAATARKRGWDQEEMALRGGEDYRLLGCSSRDGYEKLSQHVSGELGRTLFEIGEISERRGLFLCRESGESLRLTAKSFDHFSAL